MNYLTLLRGSFLLGLRLFLRLLLRVLLLDLLGVLLRFGFGFGGTLAEIVIIVGKSFRN